VVESKIVKDKETYSENKIESRKPKEDDWTNKPRQESVLANIVNSHPSTLQVNIINAPCDRPAKPIEQEKEAKKTEIPSVRHFDLSETKTRDDINVRFVRNDAAQVFGGTRFNNTFSTPQTDKFAHRLNSYGLLRQNDSTKSMGSTLKSSESASTQRSYNKPKDPSPVRRRKSPENQRIFSSSITRDSQPSVLQSSIKTRTPMHTRKSPENIKIFASSIIRDNSPAKKYSEYAASQRVHSIPQANQSSKSSK
jgi:hypothetical protein